MKMSTSETTKSQRRRSANQHEQTDSIPPTRHTPPKRRPSLLLDSLFRRSGSSSSGDLSSHSFGALHEVSKYSGDTSGGFKGTEMAYYDGSKSDSMLDYGRSDETPRTKRRRLMQRRNSQTPAMLLASSATVFIASGGFGDTIERGVDVDEALNMSLMSLAPTDASESTGLNNGSSSTDCLYDSQCWSKGVEIAEDLVKHIQRK